MGCARGKCTLLVLASLAALDSPAASPEVWLAPLGPTDLLELFDSPDAWPSTLPRIHVVQLPAEWILAAPEPDLGRLVGNLQ